LSIQTQEWPTGLAWEQGHKVHDLLFFSLHDDCYVYIHITVT